MNTFKSGTRVRTCYGTHGTVVCQVGIMVTVQFDDGSFSEFHHTKVFA